MNESTFTSSLPTAELVRIYRGALAADVPLETINSKIDQVWQRQQVSEGWEANADAARVRKMKQQVPLPMRIFSSLMPIICIVIGIFLVGNAALPILGYFVTGADLQASNLLSPIPNAQVLDAMPKIIAQAKESSNKVLGESEEARPVIIDSELDYTNLSNWFTGTQIPKLAETNQEYRLDIPDLDISNAVVKVGGTNLDHNLVQYPGTAMPGQVGNPVIFGHSVLRQFYNPSEKNSRRYFSIFSKIMTLNKGQKIYVTYDNVQYTYIVQEKFEVKPDDPKLLEQDYGDRHLRLVTCTPEGTTLRRGVLVATLEE
jgi:sortase A